MSLALRNSTPQARLESLKTKKAHLESELQQEQKCLSASDIYLRQLKKMKLQLKQEIESLETSKQKVS